MDVTVKQVRFLGFAADAFDGSGPARHFEASPYAEIGAVLMEHAFGYLDRPLRRLAIPDTPVPMAEHLVDALAPSTADIVATVRELVR